MPTMVDSYSSKRASTLAGVTFRQLDYWARTGVLPDNAAGSGSRRRFTATEVLLAAVVAEAQSAANGATSCLDAFREHQERVLGMLDQGVQFLALVGGTFVDVADTSSLVDEIRMGYEGEASWTMIDVIALKARIESRRAEAVSVALQVARP